MAKLVEPRLYEQVIGSIMKNPLLLNELNEESIQYTDFDISVYRIIFLTVYNLIHADAKKINQQLVFDTINASDNLKAVFDKNNGETVLMNCEENSNEENFMYSFRRLKKINLLRDLRENGFDISYYYKDFYNSNKEAIQYEERFENATLEEILDTIEGNFTKVKNKYADGTTSAIKKANTGLRDLINGFKTNPEIGPPLSGDYMTAVCRGARKGKFYLRSAPSNVGKTRFSVFDACEICYPIRWRSDGNGNLGFFKEIDSETGKMRQPQRTLFITTEMEAKEIQTVILANIAGVDETKILDGVWDLDKEEEARINFALDIMDKYEDFLFLEEISDPNLLNIQSTMKKHILLNKVENIFYDYLFTSPSLISMFSGTGVREDVALGMLSNQIKEIAKTHNVFIMSSTQVNADGLKWDTPKDQSCLRGM